MQHVMQRAAIITAALLSIPGTSLAADGAQDSFKNFFQDVFQGGHAKYIYTQSNFPGDSLFNDAIGNPARDHAADIRLKFSQRMDHWGMNIDYQLLADRGDRVRLAQTLPGNLLVQQAVPDDSRRLMNLTHTLSEGDDYVVEHRLDRLYAEYAGDNTVVRIGRQAVTWGNGLIYTPMDFFNPFDPAAIDKEYKTGDDMLYAQQLLASGDDIQGVWVVRRDKHGNVSAGVDSLAMKYHGFAGSREYDLLLASHYRDWIIGAGGITDFGSAILRGDITLTRSNADTITGNTVSDTIFSLVTSSTWSWIWGGHNMTGIVEYYYNGFGQPGSDYKTVSLANNPALVDRLARGELYTLGRNYLGTSVTVEMTPLWQLTPNTFINLDDPSMLFQLLSQYSLQQNMDLLAAVGIPVGAQGTEFGGIDSTVNGKPLSTGFSLYAQLAWYF